TWRIVLGGVVVCGGAGVAYGATPVLIMASVPTSAVGSATRFSTLMRSIGQSTAAAVLGVVLPQMVTDFGGAPVPTEAGFQVGLLIGTGVSLAAAGVAAVIPPAWVAEE